MWSFFHGWRRKAGVVTLGLACCFMIGWFRSLAVSDRIELGANRSFESGNGYLFSTTIYPSKVYDSGWTKDVSQVPMHPGLKIRWEWSRLGLMASESAVYRQGVQSYSISYWYPITTLTLLSAYLILWKPRKAKTCEQPAISDLISN